MLSSESPDYSELERRKKNIPCTLKIERKKSLGREETKKKGLL